MSRNPQAANQYANCGENELDTTDRSVVVSGRSAISKLENLRETRTIELYESDRQNVPAIQ